MSADAESICLQEDYLRYGSKFSVVPLSTITSTGFFPVAVLVLLFATIIWGWTVYLAYIPEECCAKG
jgi:hypothetical protein